MTAAKYYYRNIKTPIGSFLLKATDRGICGVDFPFKTKRARDPRLLPAKVKRTFFRVSRYFEDYFCNKRISRPIRKLLDWSCVGFFDQKVLRTLMGVARGKTISYAELAKKCGVPKGARAIGNAVGKNPFPLLVPCHRVIRKNGALGGFSAGIFWKKKLLQIEKNKRGGK